MLSTRSVIFNSPTFSPKPRSVRAQAVGIGTRWQGCHSPVGSPAHFPSMSYHFNLGIFHPGSTSLFLAQTPQDHHPLFLSWAIQSSPSCYHRRLHPTPYQPLHREPVYCEQALSHPWPFAGLCPLPPPLYWSCPSLNLSSTQVGVPPPFPSRLDGVTIVWDHSILSRMHGVNLTTHYWCWPGSPA